MSAVGALAAGVAVALALLACGPGPFLSLPAWRWRDLTPWAIRRARSRRRRGEASVIPALEGLAGASRAGLVLREALAIARERAAGELADRIGDALAREDLGAPLGDALAAVRAGAVGHVDAFLADAQLCATARLGSDRAAALCDDVLGGLRFERELRSDLRARTAGQRFQIWLLAAVVPGLALYLSAMSPTLAEELSSPLGRLLIPAGALFEIAGIVLSRRIVARAWR